MSDHDEVMERLDWLVKAVKYLLSQEEPAGLIEADEDMSEHEHFAVRTPPKPAPCTHQHQQVVDGVVRCAKCMYPLIQSGVVGDPNRHGIEALRTEWGRNSLMESNLG